MMSGTQLGAQSDAQSERAEGVGTNGRAGDTARSARRAKTAGRATAARRPRAGAPQQSERELLSAINEKLDRVVAVLAAQGRDRDTQVAILAAAGCDSAFVGTLIGMSPGAVRKLPAWRRSQGDGPSQGEGTSTEGAP